MYILQCLSACMLYNPCERALYSSSARQMYGAQCQRMRTAQCLCTRTIRYLKYCTCVLYSASACATNGICACALYSACTYALCGAYASTVSAHVHNIQSAWHTYANRNEYFLKLIDCMHVFLKPWFNVILQTRVSTLNKYQDEICCEVHTSSKQRNNLR